MKDEKPKSKCFLKCFAEKLEFFNNVTAEPNRDRMVEYVEYLKPGDMPVSFILKSFGNISNFLKSFCFNFVKLYSMEILWISV